MHERLSPWRGETRGEVAIESTFARCWYCEHGARFHACRSTIGMRLALSETYRCRGVQSDRGGRDVVVVVVIGDVVIVVIVQAFIVEHAVVQHPRETGNRGTAG